MPFLSDTLLMVGMSHQTAPVEVRERFGFTGASCDRLLADTEAFPGEMVILSTCNRTELYTVLPEGSSLASRDVLQVWARFAGVDEALLVPHVVFREGPDVVRHLCRVAAGLESLVLGEPQILGQVSEALNRALAHRRAGATLKALFHTALRTGKRARSETAISRNPASVSSVAVRLVSRVLGGLEGRHVAVVGAGEMARLALKVLKKHTPARLTIVNRDVARAAALAGNLAAAPHVGTACRPLSELDDVLAAADVVISATGAPHLILEARRAEAALARRSGRPIVLIDIALPRDVDPALAGHPLVQLFDIDELQAEVEASLKERQKEVPRVERIVDEEIARFAAWARQHRISPVIARLRRKAEAIRRQELERALAALPEADDAVREQMYHLSRTLVKKLLHDPTVRLRNGATEHRGQDYAEAVRYLFGLEDSATS
ncbi:MAG: glutamyl-tRNA reductase [Rhodothermaceae bacterium]|nr:MAG: glutamyl-tRNA reductase [Rhodothermaceae bacterium]